VIAIDVITIGILRLMFLVAFIVVTQTGFHLVLGFISFEQAKKIIIFNLCLLSIETLFLILIY